MAEYERRGAELEPRWAELVDPSPAQSMIRDAGVVLRQTRRDAKQLSAVLTRTANELERSAGLAEAHARRREQAGQSDDAIEERQAAKRAREAAQRALAQADEWLKASEKH
jgi:hypothetical protein